MLGLDTVKNNERNQHNTIVKIKENQQHHVNVLAVTLHEL